MATITHTDGAITPVAVEAFSATSASRNRVHVILGRPGPTVTLGTAGLREGEFSLVFDDAETAGAAFTILRTAQTFTIHHPTVSLVGMAFVLQEDGDLAIEQDHDNPDIWRVIVPFQEVTE